jgi:hypothetical protein
MKYAIETPEIEVSRLRKAIRETHATAMGAPESWDIGGYYGNIQSMESLIRELNIVIEILSQNLNGT